MDYKYTIESLKREQGSLIEKKRQIEQAFCLGQVEKSLYESIHQQYEDRYKELNVVINKLEQEPKIDFHSESGTINSDEFKEFLELKHINQVSPVRYRVKTIFDLMIKIYEEYGIDAFKDLIPFCVYDDRLGYVIKLDESVAISNKG
ncbi:MAG: hypothetical protein HPY57_15000 [Ignavibacteria bacterium]|nr:hypothetical protein [Ignavibacteria bacterium]